MRLLNLAVVALAAVPFGSALPSPQSEKQKSPKEIQKHPDSDSPPEGYGPEKYHRIDEKYICAKFDGFAKEADFIFNLVNVLECGDDQCWEPVRNAIYKLEYGIDVVDTDIDNSDRSYIWSCSQEAIISGCYQRVCDALVRAWRASQPLTLLI